MVAQELQPCEAECFQGPSRSGIDKGADLLRFWRVGEDGREILSVVVFLVVPVKRGVCRLLVESGQNTVCIAVVEEVISGARLDGIQVGEVDDVQLGECCGL
jgi:hypothetical protein